MDDSILVRILTQCPLLESLHFECSYLRYGQSSVPIDTAALLASQLPRSLALRELNFGHFLWSFVQSLLPYCSRLVKITIPPLNGVSLDKLCQLLDDQNACPQLAVLDFARVRNAHCDVFTRILHSCRRLTITEVNLVWGSADRHTLMAIWQHHGATIETLRVTRCMDSVTSEDLAAIIATCPKLKVLHLQSLDDQVSLMAKDIVSMNGDDSGSSSSITNCSYTRTPATWTCLNLVELRVAISGICTRRREYCPTHDDCQTTQRNVYRLFSQLRYLRVLDVGCRSGIARSGLRRRGGLEWTLASGMEQLHTLRCLEELSARHMANGMDVPELEWMKEHWPRLNCVEGFFMGRTKDDQVETWLRERWPTLSWS
ncbi:hypothetical protein BGW42_007540 [Actinomortierella wolfii]|nr:hypothetical protein BGW42_007540 [Actinomortierella wolfii]